MEYKFKTLYKERLVDCFLVHHFIYIPEGGIISKIGTYVEEPPIEWPVLPVFQYIGKTDRLGQEIYCGHVIRYEDYWAEVVWNAEYCCYQLRSFYPLTSTTCFIGSQYFRSNNMTSLDRTEIIYHSAIGPPEVHEGYT